MISDIPSADDFYISGKELMGFAWETVAELLLDLEQADYFGYDKQEISDAYWNAAKRRLATALVITQQGVEFLLKGRIAEVSPFLLLSDHSSKWPSPYEENPPKFSQFRTLDAQDLVRVHDTVQADPLSAEFTAWFGLLREKRNSIMHSVDKTLNVPVLEVLEAILYMHKQFFPSETWGQMRCQHLLSAPDIELGSIDYVKNRVCHEVSVVIGLLAPAKVQAYFRIDKKQRRYLCPRCHEDANHDGDDIEKLAVLQPKGKGTKQLYCPACNAVHPVTREECPDEECQGNVLCEESERCLTCGR